MTCLAVIAVAASTAASNGWTQLEPDRAQTAAEEGWTRGSRAPRGSPISLIFALRQQRTGELREYKALCDRLLPGLRTQSHLYNLLRSSLCYSATICEHGIVVGGASFRLIHAAHGALVILDVLTLAVDQQPGVCDYPRISPHGVDERQVRQLEVTSQVHRAT